MSFNLSIRRHRLIAALPPRFFAVPLILAAIATQACGGGDGGGGGGTTNNNPPAVASIDVAPSPLSVTAGLTAQLTATPKSAAGAALTGRTISWSSADQTIANVSTSGLVTAVKVGGTTVTATSEGVHQDVAVTVTAAPVASIDLTPSPLTVTAGQTAQLTATPKSAAGAALSGRTISWSSADQTIASVSTTGVVTAVKVGSTTVTATSEGVHQDVAVTVAAVAIATIDVTPTPLSVTAGLTSQLTATPRSSTGAALTERQISWTTGDATIATVSLSGLVSGVKAGTTTITATSEGIHKDVPVTVAPGAVASVIFATQPASAVAGTSIGSAIQVQLLDANGTLVTSSAAPVTLTLTGGTAGASLGGTATVNAVNGVATFSLSMTRKGSAYHLVASASGFQATSNAFNVDASAPTAIAKLAGDAQTAVVGTAVPTPPSVQLIDAFGNMVNGITVTFAPAAGSGSVAGGSVVTDANGIAPVGSWTVGTTMGPNTLTASAGSLSATFNASVTGAVTPGIQFVVGALGSASSASVATGQDIAVPLTLDLTNRGSADLAAIQLTINWDPARLTFKSESAGNWTDSQQNGASVTINTADAGTGVIRIAGFTTSATLSSFVLRNLVFTGAAAGSVTITTTITTAGNAAGTSIPVAPRALAVTVTP